MSESEHHDDALRDVLRQTVEHIHSSPDLAERVENAARRRRTARRSSFGALALAALATTGVLTAGHSGARQEASPATTGQVQAPTCAADENAYWPYVPASVESRPPTKTPVVPGTPVIAVVCRYGPGDLAASATVTGRAQLDQLQTTMNASRAYTGGMYCLAAGMNAVVLFGYPHGAADLTVVYSGACVSLYTNAGSYLVSNDVESLITSFVGTWRSLPPSPSTR